MARRKNPTSSDFEGVGQPPYRVVYISKLQLQQIIDGLSLEIAKGQLNLDEDQTGVQWEFVRQLQFRKIQTQEALKEVSKIEPLPKTWFDKLYIRIYLWATSNQSVKE